jgi:hypothetical protein
VDICISPRLQRCVRCAAGCPRWRRNALNETLINGSNGGNWAGALWSRLAREKYSHPGDDVPSACSTHDGAVSWARAGREDHPDGGTKSEVNMQAMVEETRSRRRVRIERGIYRQANGKYAVCFMLDGKPRFRTVGNDLEVARAQRATFVRARQVRDGRGRSLFALGDGGQLVA